MCVQGHAFNSDLTLVRLDVLNIHIKPVSIFEMVFLPKIRCKRISVSYFKIALCI